MLLKKGLFLALLLSTAPAAFSATSWPLTFENCGVKQTFAQAPQRVVTVGQHETELLLALGLEKRSPQRRSGSASSRIRWQMPGKISPACR